MYTLSVIIKTIKHIINIVIRNEKAYKIKNGCIGKTQFSLKNSKTCWREIELLNPSFLCSKCSNCSFFIHRIIWNFSDILLIFQGCKVSWIFCSPTIWQFPYPITIPAPLCFFLNNLNTADIRGTRVREGHVFHSFFSTL